MLNHNKFLTPAVMLLLVSLLVSCNKNDNPKPQTKTELLTQHAWKFSSATSTNAAFQDILTENFANAIYTFKKDHTYSISSMNEKGVWEFSADETTILLDKSTPDADALSITKLTTTSLELSFQFTDDDTKKEISSTLVLIKN